MPDGCDPVLHLMGTVGLAEFLAFAHDFADLTVPGTGALGGATPMDLAEAWRDAADVYQSINTAEAYPEGLPGLFPFTDAMHAHCEAFLAKPHVQREFDQVPVALAMVPLAHLIVATQRLNGTTVSGHGAALGAGAVADLALVQHCLPLEPPAHSLQLIEQHDGSATFASDQPEIAFLGAHLAHRATGFIDATVTQRTVPGVRGHTEQTLALALGFPGNVLNVIRYQNRLFLNNGYHRALALLKRGVTHVPAVIQVCRHWDDVGLVGSAALFNQRALFAERERPPLLKDFVDPRLCMSFAVPRRRAYLRIRYAIETGHLRDTVPGAVVTRRE